MVRRLDFFRQADRSLARVTLNRKTIRLFPFAPVPTYTSAPRIYTAEATCRYRGRVQDANRRGSICRGIIQFQVKVKQDQTLIDRN